MTPPVALQLPLAITLARYACQHLLTIKPSLQYTAVNKADDVDKAVFTIEIEMQLAGR